MNRSPLKRRKSLREYSQAKMLREGRKGHQGLKAVPMEKRGGMFDRPRKALKKQSVARAKDMRLYYEEVRVWLNEPAHRACAICLCLGETPRASTEVHHSRGRIGRLLRYQPFWIPSCRPCREIPHNRPAWAREVGLLCPASEWNVFPR